VFSQILTGSIVLSISMSVFAGGATSVGPDVKAKACISNGGVVVPVANLNSSPVEEYALCEFQSARVELSTFSKRKNDVNIAIQSFKNRSITDQQITESFLIEQSISFCKSLNGSIRTVYDRQRKSFFGTCFFADDGSEIGLETLYLGTEHPLNKDFIKTLE
jgi:hypothetical protein